MSSEVINRELADRHAAICFDCGAIFTNDSFESGNECPECGEYQRTRWITPARSWLRPVKMGMFTERIAV